MSDADPPVTQTMKEAGRENIKQREILDVSLLKGLMKALKLWQSEYF